jgi:hypothetical protein
VNIREWPESKKIAERLDNDFKKAVFDAALKSFEQVDNPLRVNNLATGLRELTRLILRDMAPDKDIEASCWYKPETNLQGKIVITRSQRIDYAIHAGLPIDFVEKTLHVDLKGTKKKFSELFEQLNKFTHIEEKTFNVDEVDAEQFAENALETFSALYETIDDCRASLQVEVEDFARNAVTDDLFNDVVSELDQLATHYTLSGVDLEDLSVDVMDSKTLAVSIAGNVDCEHQYGSDSDMARGDGAQSSGSYPFKAKYTANIAEPSKMTLVYDTLKVDNTSFYEGQDDEE